MKNFVLKGVSEKTSNVVKGILLIIISVPISVVLGYYGTQMMGVLFIFGFDNRSLLHNISLGMTFLIFAVFVSIAIRIIVRPTNKVSIE